MKTFFEKLEDCFSVESTTIESATFPYKTVLSKANFKTNRISTTWIIKNAVLSLTTLFFSKSNFSVRTSYK